jgi:hypothetical protein
MMPANDRRPARERTCRVGAERGHMTDEEREDLLQLLANYENMARGVESLIHYLRTEPSINLDTGRYKGPLQDIIELVPVWRNYASTLRVKFMLDRRAVPRE